MHLNAINITFFSKATYDYWVISNVGPKMPLQIGNEADGWQPEPGPGLQFNYLLLFEVLSDFGRLGGVATQFQPLVILVG